MRFPASSLKILRAPLLVLLTGALVLAAGVWGVSQDIAKERRLALIQGETQAADIAGLLNDHLHQTIRRLDQALLHLRREYAADPDWFIEKAAGWQRSVYADLAFQISVVGADGKLIFTNLVNVKDPVDLSDREHFRIHRERRSDELFISKPVLGRVSQKWSIQFTRPILDRDEAFAGVMVLSVEVDRLSEIYRAVDLGRQGSVTLTGTDRVVRARSAELPSGKTAVGMTVAAHPLYSPDAPAEGALRLVSTIDGVARLGAYSRLSAYPLVVAVLYSEQELLAALAEQEKEKIAGAATAGALIALGVVTVALLLWREGLSRRRLESALQNLAAQEERWRLALDAVGDGVWDWSVDGDKVYFSPRWKAMLGYDDRELPGELYAWRDRVHPDDLPHTLADVEKLVSGETLFYVNEHRLLGRDGAWRWVLARGVAVARDAEGRALRAVGTHTDVTGRREMEEALRRQTEALSRSNAELEAFAYVASHDLRQPLRTVNSYAALLERELGESLSDDAKEFLGFIRDGAKRMDRLVVDLLEYSRVGRNCAPFAPVAMTAAAQDAVANLNAALQESRGAVTVADDLPVARGDESELLRLFQNLIGNAIKYRRPDRPPEIAVTAEAQDDHWVFSVADNGIGVDPQHFERIFGIFQRLHGPTEGIEGTGVGLALCKKIVERHGGRIWVESTPGEGCVFRFTLPRT